VPTVGVGGHCLPKDGILLWWRALEAGEKTDRSLILESRRINDESPAYALFLAERAWGPLRGRRTALLGAAYRFNSEDTRNSPTLVLGRLLQEQGAQVTIHDPYVYPTDQNLRRAGLDGVFTRDLDQAVAEAEVLFLCTAHRVYLDRRTELLNSARRAVAVLDACNAWSRSEAGGLAYAGIGRGTARPGEALVEDVLTGFRAVEKGVANELSHLVAFLNERHATDHFNEIRFEEVQRIAGTCVTGCEIVSAGPAPAMGGTSGFRSRLAARALGSQEIRRA